MMQYLSHAPASDAVYLQVTLATTLLITNKRGSVPTRGHRCVVWHNEREYHAHESTTKKGWADDTADVAIVL